MRARVTWPAWSVGHASPWNRVHGVRRTPGGPGVAAIAGATPGIARPLPRGARQRRIHPGKGEVAFRRGWSFRPAPKDEKLHPDFIGVFLEQNIQLRWLKSRRPGQLDQKGMSQAGKLRSGAKPCIQLALAVFGDGVHLARGVKILGLHLT